VVVGWRDMTLTLVRSRAIATVGRSLRGFPPRPVVLARPFEHAAGRFD
jgi:hypothetical protein